MITPEPSLLEIQQILSRKRMVDLTHAFEPGMPHWPGFPDETRETLYHYDEGVGSRGHGFFAETFHHIGQWGTHVDPPAHFIRGLRTVDEIPLAEMILPLVVIDVHDEVEQDADYTPPRERLELWEQEHGRIPAGSFVALRTDWSKRWPDATRVENRDAAGVMHFPGWSRGALEFLLEERGITALGHETTDTDPGFSTSVGDYSLESYVLGTDHYQIELLANLDVLPATGAIIFATWPKPKGGSGFPARVWAVLPD